MISKRQRLARPSEGGFPENVPWCDLWQLVHRIKDGEVRSYFEEAIWCLRSGGFRAAAVLGWVAIASHLGNAARRLPKRVLDIHTPKGARSKDNEAFLSMCRRLTLFGLNTTETTPEDQELKTLLDFRNRWAHAPLSRVDQNRDEVIRLVRDLGEQFLTRDIEAFQFEQYSVVVELAKNPTLQCSFEPIEARQVVAFVREDQMLRLTEDLLAEYLTHTYPGTKPDQFDREGTTEVSEEISDDEAILHDWLNADANVARLWVEAYARLEDSGKVVLLDVLLSEYAERTYCLAEDRGDRIELVSRNEVEPVAKGQRTLGELAQLLVWKEGHSPKKYRDAFYTCFLANPGELASIPEVMRQEIADHSPEEYRQQLREALYGYNS